jgi:undecaprenyl diphosphate synthase
MAPGQAEALNLLTAEQPAADGPGAPPVHVAVIMDGNGRWAKQRGLPRVEGHRRGVEAVRRLVRAAIDLGIRHVTIYSFSSENWARPASEVRDLMGLLRFFIRNDLAELDRNGVRVRVIGERAGLPEDICGLLAEAEQTTASNTRLDLVVAFNYGGRQEIVSALRRLSARITAGELQASEIGEQHVSAALDTAGLPDPDLLIRTSGEQRLSNFLPWQTAYTELVFTPVLWPDFDRLALESCIAEFRSRERRFGGLGSVR